MLRGMAVAEPRRRSTSSCASPLCDSDVSHWAVREWIVIWRVKVWDSLRAIWRLVRGGPAYGGALMAWLSPILENISNVFVSGCGVRSAVIAPVSTARPDGATNKTRSAVEPVAIGAGPHALDSNAP